MHFAKRMATALAAALLSVGFLGVTAGPASADPQACAPAGC